VERALRRLGRTPSAARPAEAAPALLPPRPQNRHPRDAGWRGETGRLRETLAAQPGPAGAPERPFAVVDATRGALRLFSTDPAADAAGLRPGMALADARAIRPDLETVEADGGERAALESMADWARRFTPLAGRDGRDGLMLDVAGCAHLFGGEAGLLAECLDRFAAQGFAPVGVIAETPAAARSLTRAGRSLVVPTGEARRAVDPLPVEALCLEPEVAEGLRAAGLRRIGDCLLRPRAPLAARFGQGLLDRLDEAAGLAAPSPITPRFPAPVYLVERRFQDPIAREEDVLAAAARLAGDLCRLFERHGEGGLRFELALFRLDGAVRRLTVSTARPTRRPEALLRLLRERLGGLADPLDPGFGYDLVRLAALAAERLEDGAPAMPGLRPAQPRDAGADAGADLVDRLAARLGPGAVLRPVLADAHLPELAGGLARAAAAERRSARLDQAMPIPLAPGEGPRRPIRLFANPEPVEAMAEIPDGAPLRFRWRRALHEVARAEGPERILPPWWSHAGPPRDYFRIEDREGRRFWLYREGLYGHAGAPRWFMHGLFG
jgi:protein ImuB